MPELSEVLDRLAVIEALSSFHQAADSGDWTRLGTLITEDVRWSWRGEDESGQATDSAAGAAEVVAWLRSVMTGSTVRHYTTNHVASVKEDTAETTSYLATIDTTSLRILASGVVQAAYRRSGGRWSIAAITVDERVPAGSIATLRARVAEGSPS